MNKTVKIFENFLTNSLFVKTQNKANEIIKNPYVGLSRTNFAWPTIIVKASTPVIVKDIDKTDELFKELKQEIEEKTGWEVLNIMIYYWTKLSYIPWHEDPGLNAGFTLYLNETWDKDWGGYFMYELEEGQIKALIPTRNTAVIQEGNVPHSVSTINMDSEIRISLQVFFDNKIK